GWLFVSQGRAREHLHFHVIDSAVKVASVLAGLAWGATGVAVGVAVRYYVMLPLLLWMVGRRGPVATRDLYALLTLPAPVAAACLASVTIVRALLGPMSPLPGLGVAIVAAGAAAGVFALTPHGRRVAKDVLLVT